MSEALTIASVSGTCADSLAFGIGLLGPEPPKLGKKMAQHHNFVAQSRPLISGLGLTNPWLRRGGGGVQSYYI